MKKISILLLTTLLIITGCSKSVEKTNSTDDVVVLGTSLVDLIDKTDLNIVGVSQDALDNGIIDNVEDVGQLLTVNLELIIELNPKYVITGSKYPNYDDIVSALEDTPIEIITLDYNNFAEYKLAVKQVAELTGDNEYYDEMTKETEQSINDYIDLASEFPNRKALIVRSSETTLKVVDSSYFSSEIIENMNITNIANTNDNLALDLSIEYIVEEDPDYIFVIEMGSDDSINGFNNFTSSNPAWNSLSAVTNNNVHYLPKGLFHNKPNNRWDEAYEHIYEIQKTENKS